MSSDLISISNFDILIRFNNMLIIKKQKTIIINKLSVRNICLFWSWSSCHSFTAFCLTHILIQSKIHLFFFLAFSYIFSYTFSCFFISLAFFWFLLQINFFYSKTIEKFIITYIFIKNLFVWIKLDTFYFW